MPFIYLSYLIALDRTYNAMLNRNNQSGHSLKKKKNTCITYYPALKGKERKEKKRKGKERQKDPVICNNMDETGGHYGK